MPVYMICHDEEEMEIYDFGEYDRATVAFARLMEIKVESFNREELFKKRLDELNKKYYN